jgi:hypothetical protein
MGACEYQGYIAESTNLLATARVHSDVCGCLYELHLLFPFHRQNAWISQGRNAAPHCSSVLPSVSILNLELVAFWTFRRALFPHRRRMCYLRCRPDNFNDNTSNCATLLCNVSASHGIFLRLPTHSTLGIGDYPTTKIKESRDARAGDCRI